MTTETFGHIGASGNFKQEIPVLQEHLNVLVRNPNAVFLTLTEQDLDGPARDAAFARPGWEFFQDDREDGYDQNVVMWRSSRATLLDATAVPLTNMSIFRKSGTKAPATKATVATFGLHHSNKKVTVIKYHAALDNTERRKMQWLDETLGVRKTVAAIRKIDRRRKFIVSADYNRDWRLDNERALIRRNLAIPLRMRQSWNYNGAGLPGGTHGRRELIDGDLSNMTVLGARILPGSVGNDHRPYMITYKI